jgi:histidinol phosphatase-like enzyme
MVYYFDIDGTICTMSKNLNYEEAQPIKDRIDKVNELYNLGHTIVYWTARGTVTGKDWSGITKKQFKTWGVKYHDLKFGKPFYDLFIDDRNINDESFFKD